MSAAWQMLTVMGGSEEASGKWCSCTRLPHGLPSAIAQLYMVAAGEI